MKVKSNQTAAFLLWSSDLVVQLFDFFHGFFDDLSEIFQLFFLSRDIFFDF